MVAADELLTTARTAYARGDWHAAYLGLSRADGLTTLSTDDLAALADAAWWLGRMPDSLRISEEVFRRLQAEGHAARAAMNALGLSLIWWTRGDVSIGSGWISRARRILQGLPEGIEHGYLSYLEGSFAFMSDDLAQASAEAVELQEMAVRLGSPPLTSFGLVLDGLVQIRQGSTRSGFALLDEAMLPVLAGQVPALWAGDIYCTTIHVCHELADLRRMREWTEATERWCERFHAVTFLGICRVHRLQLLSVEGSWDEVEAQAGLACAELEAINGWVTAEGFYELGEIRRLRGNPAAAEEAFAKARELGIDPQPGEALLQLAAGRADSAWAGLVSALDGLDPLARARLLGPAVQIALANGHVADAGRLCAELERIAADYASVGFRAWAGHARGALLLAQARPEEAAAALQSAMRDYRELRAQYDTAQIYELLAQVHEARGQVDLATADQATAISIFRRLGATPDVLRLSATSPLPGNLTPREVEVLGHIAAGSSNKGVAAALCISEKTVGRHLSNIFAKLGVSSRTAAAAWAHAHGVLTPPLAPAVPTAFAPSASRKDPESAR